MRVEKGYEGDFSVGRVEVGGDAVFYLDASVDGTGGNLRHKPVFTAQQAADYLNRGIGKINGEETGAIWRGAYDHLLNGRHSDADFSLDATPAKSNDYVSGPLTHLNFGFYNSTADIDLAYSYIGGNTETNLRLDGFSPFSAAQRDAARQAINAWDELIAINFVETDAAHADINFMNTTTGPAQASAYLPYDYTPIASFFGRVAGDVAVNPAQPSNALFDEGQYGLTTLVHELGHSLGLEHPGSYNFGPNFSATYENGAEYYQDSNQYSIMSYWDAEETGAAHVDWRYLTYRYSSTPSVHDILSIQQMYGADYSTRSGNDTYGFNTSLSTHSANSVNDDSYDFVKTPDPVVTIWDGGGTDTLDLSGYSTDSIINLNPGAFSSAGGYFSNTIPTLAEINAHRAEIGLAPRSQATYDLYVELFKSSFTNGLLRDNISIAYNVIIENAVGGGGNDTITGNAVANVLSGLGGNDKINGGAGDDTLIGGLGIDDLTGGAGRDTFVFGDLSVDKIRDFDSGVDKIDLSAFDLTASNVKLTKDSVFADTDHNGSYDLHIVVNGEQVQMSDVFFG